MTRKKKYSLKPAMILSIAVGTFLLAGCELDDISFDSSLKGTIEVDEPTEGEDVAYSETIMLDATEDSEIEKYEDKIVGVTVNKIEYKIEDYDGPDECIFNGTLSFGDKNSATGDIIASVTDLDLQQVYASGEAIELPVDESDMETIAEMLMNDKAMNVFVEGTLSQTPVYFKIKVMLDVTVNASVLE